MDEMMIRANGAELCVATAGKRGDPAVLLIAGAMQSMDWWEDGFCTALAARGRYVIRYDQRDTGRSSTYPAGAPGYGWRDLLADALAVLDALGVGTAHVVGLSMGGGLAQHLALEHRDRLSALTLIATSPIDPAIDGLPAPSPEIQAAASAPAPDWTDRDAAIEYLVADLRRHAGTFDEQRMRTIAGRAFDRSTDLAASTNHFALDGDGPAHPQLARLAGLPTLVLHGSLDPLFPPEHGRALAAAIPGATLTELDGMGHEQPPPHTWDRVISLLAAQPA